jgi:hypothetical protein
MSHRNSTLGHSERRHADSQRGSAALGTVTAAGVSAAMVMSSYALHHVRDCDKVRLVADAFGWLRPGGRWRIAKSAARYLLRSQECRVPMAVRMALLTQAGFAALPQESS